MSAKIASTLPMDIARMAEAQVTAGHYATVEDVLRAGMEAVELQQERRQALRAALEEGEASGVAEDSTLEGILDEFRARRAR